MLLDKDDIDVTNSKDKEVQLEKLRNLNTEVRAFFAALVPRENAQTLGEGRFPNVTSIFQNIPAACAAVLLLLSLSWCSPVVFLWGLFLWS